MIATSSGLKPPIPFAEHFSVDHKCITDAATIRPSSFTTPKESSDVMALLKSKTHRVMPLELSAPVETDTCVYAEVAPKIESSLRHTPLLPDHDLINPEHKSPPPAFLITIAPVNPEHSIGLQPPHSRFLSSFVLRLCAWGRSVPALR
jgi:hypothetical protein